MSTQPLLDFALEPQVSLTERVYRLFASRPNEWIDMHELAKVGGTGGWRSRVAELRFPPYSLNIVNKQQRAKKLQPDGSTSGYTVSLYRWQP